MGIPLWRSILFFTVIAIFGLWLFPTERELGMLYTKTKVFHKAHIYLAKHFKRAPQDVANALRYLESLVHEAQFDSAEQIAQSLDRKFPNDLRVHEKLAQFHEDNLRLDQASRHWAKILTTNPLRKDIREKLVTYYLLAKRSDDLIRFYEGEIKKQVADLPTYYALQDIYAFKKKDSKAQAVLLQLLEQYPSETNAKIKLAQTYQFQGKSEELVRVYEQLKKEQPEDKKLDIAHTELLANDHIQKKQKKKAIELYEGLYERHPAEYGALRILGELYLESNDNQQALAKLKEYHEKAQGDYQSYHLLGDVYAAMDQPFKSREAYNQALELIHANRKSTLRHSY